MTTLTEVPIAGVPWPVYKLVALAIGALVLVVVGIYTMSVGTAVVAAFATATAIWLALGVFGSTDA
ncbi:MAG: hypothetical protein ABW137_10175 [Mycobacterium sp.]